ncbi:hypothetical protein BDL97_03G070700 [Sphagnum fallax]|nr:hypothetical protein BDL97_03G070700 [Sphagnum fallax]
MRKKGRRKNPLPEIQEEGLITPLRRGSSAYAFSNSPEPRRPNDLEAGTTTTDSHLTSNVEMAAALVDQAMLGRWMPLAVVYHKDYQSAKRTFLLYHQLSPARGIIYFLFLILPFFEIPGWCNENLPNPCGDPKKFPVSGLPYIRPWISLTIEVLVVVFLLLSAWLATKFFSETTPEFMDFNTSLLNLFVLLTTANNPVVWASVYAANRMAFFFFFTYMIVGLFFLMNLAFSVIYSNYKAQMAVEVAKRTTARQGNLRAAFSLLDTREQEWIDGATMISLFLIIGRYRHIPDVRARTSRLFLALNKRGDFKIWSDEFEELCDVIAKEVEREPDALHKLKRHRSRSDIHFVKHPFYACIIWALTFTSLSIAIAALNVTGTILILLLSLEFLFGWLFVMDAMLKSCVQGWKSYWRNHVNRFDFVLTILIIVVHFMSFLYPETRFWVSYLMIARSFRAVVLITMISRWRLMAETLFHVIPATAPILALQFVICSLFSLLGMHVFGGLIYKGNSALDGTEYALHGFYAFNYNDYASAMATSFNLCVVNKWYVFMDAYAAVTGSRWSRAFFIAFWAIAVAFTLNVVVAFFAEALTSQLEKAERAKAREQRRSDEDLLTRGPGLLLRKKSSSGNLPHRATKSLSYYDLYEDIVKKR